MKNHLNHGMKAKQKKNTKSVLPVRSLGALAMAVGMLVGMAHGQEEKKKENSLPWELQAVRLIRKEKPESEKELQELLKSEQEKGNKKAGLVLALRLAGGFSGEQNHDEARKIIEPLATEGDADAQWLLAYDEMTRLTLGKNGNKERIASLLKDAADQGHHGAQAAYAAFCRKSNDKEEKTMASKYAEKAAEQGNSYAMYPIPTAGMSSDDLMEHSKKSLAAWEAGCVQAAGNVIEFSEGHSKEFAESGSSFCMNSRMVGICRQKGDRMNETKWLTLASEGGDLFAVHILSNMTATEAEKNYHDAFGYDHDELVYFDVPQNLSKAVELYNKAAGGGHVLAMYKLANCYELGRGTERDEKKAEELYRKAAEQKLDIAALRLGQLLLRRGGKAAKEANKWLASAAEQGNVVAKYTLGLCYLKGKGGVKKNMQRAQSLFTEAAALCDICSRYELGFAAFFAKGGGKSKKKIALETLNHAGMDCGPLCMATPMIKLELFGAYWGAAHDIIGDSRYKTDHLEADFMRVMQGNTNALCLYYLLRDLKLPKKGS